MKRVGNYLHKHKLEVVGIFLIVFSIILFILFHSFVFLLIPFAYYFLSLLVEYLIFTKSKKTPLYIITPDGYNEPYHPSAVYFEKAWNGYQYWMAFSPMPIKAAHSPYTDRWECPCVFQSNDGITFTDEFNNGFLDDLSVDEIENYDYFSDPHLVFNEITGELELYYRLTHRRFDNENNEEILLLCKKSVDGKHWSDRIVIISSLDSPIGDVFVSQAVIREKGCYKMWFVSSYGNNRSVSAVNSPDMTRFDVIQKCSFKGRSVDPWHIDCRKIGDDYIMLIYEFSNELSIWQSKNGLDFTFVKTVIKAVNNCGIFYHGLYRACLTENHIGGWNIYFSFKNKKGDGIGLAVGNSVYDCEVVAGNAQKDYSLFFSDFTDKYFNLAKKSFKKIIRRISRD